MALGAQPTHVIRLILGSNLRSLAWGLAAGLAGALAATRLVQNLAAGVSALDPVSPIRRFLPCSLAEPLPLV